jgi:acyl-CoA hydrolase
MKIKTYTTHHLVKQGDLNHHGTLYAGRSADWFVESGFIAAASVAKPENIVCLKIHGMTFLKPAQRGDILCCESRVILAGKTSLMVHVQIANGSEILLQGFLTFIHVGRDGKPLPHGIELEYSNDEEISLMKEAERIKNESR